MKKIKIVLISTVVALVSVMFALMCSALFFEYIIGGIKRGHILGMFFGAIIGFFVVLILELERRIKNKKHEKNN